MKAQSKTKMRVLTLKKNTIANLSHQQMLLVRGGLLAVEPTISLSEDTGDCQTADYGCSHPTTRGIGITPVPVEVGI